MINLRNYWIICCRQLGALRAGESALIVVEPHSLRSGGAVQCRTVDLTQEGNILLHRHAFLLGNAQHRHRAEQLEVDPLAVHHSGGIRPRAGVAGRGFGLLEDQVRIPGGELAVHRLRVLHQLDERARIHLTSGTKFGEKDSQLGLVVAVLFGGVELKLVGGGDVFDLR